MAVHDGWLDCSVTSVATQEEAKMNCATVLEFTVYVVLGSALAYGLVMLAIEKWGDFKYDKEPEPQAMPTRCASCKYRVLVSERSMECRKNPPVVIVLPHGLESSDFQTEFPEVEPEGWCGAYERPQ